MGKNSSRELISEVPFSITARVVKQFGRESISNSIVAILELVKNAYDADAEHVHIQFHGLDAESPILVIEDDGHGMTEIQLRDEWMMIGNIEKQIVGISSTKKRVLTGEKGLGRLGLDRLAKRTVVQTFTEVDDMGVELDINWEKYENTTNKLESVFHQLYRIPKQINSPISNQITEFNKGTRLTLYNLRDNWAYKAGQTWNKEFLADLKQELTLLVSPFVGINDFSITLDSGMGWSEIDGEVNSSDMLDKAEWTLKAEIIDTGYIHYVMTHRDSETVFEFSEPWAAIFKETNVSYPRCGPVRFEMYFFPRKSVPDLNLTNSQIRGFLDANQGIRIYRDGFRVQPYGDPEGKQGDWLGLSVRRQHRHTAITDQSKWKVAYNQVIGAVFIGRIKNKLLIDQTNREGIVEGPAFYDLRRFTLHAVEFFENERQKYEKLEANRSSNNSKNSNYELSKKSLIKSSEETVAAVEALEKVVQRLDSSVFYNEQKPDELRETLTQGINRLKDATAKTQQSQQEYEETIESVFEKSQEEKDTLGNLASLGIMAVEFGHETQGASNLVMTNSQLLKRNIKKLSFVYPVDIGTKINNNVDIIEKEAQRIETFAKFTLSNTMRDNRKRQNINLSEMAVNIFKVFEISLEKERFITIVLDLADDIPLIRGFKIDWESIFINLITNAVWALGETEQDKRKIRVSIHNIQNQIQIAFADSGRGLEAGTEEYIFQPTYSTRRNDKGDYIGTGMGLAIVKNFVESHQGIISVKSPCDLGGAEFLIQIPLPPLVNGGNYDHE